MHELRTVVQHYAWGSHDALPTLLGVEPDGRPWAELWVGTHRLGASEVVGTDGTTRGLREVVGDGLPYLLKVLAVDAPLSLQVHPDTPTARVGYAREEAAGVALDDPARVFKDPHHKPEMVVALTVFEGLVAFRPTAKVWQVLGGLINPLAVRLHAELRGDPGFPGLARMVGRLVDPETRPSVEEIGALVQECATRVAEDADLDRAYETVLELAAHHPGDPGVLMGLLLNRVRLEPGEAALVEEGVLHAYLSGTCVEVMASSDNVLRAGLTDKHVEPVALAACVRRGMADAYRVAPKVSAGVREYLPPVSEFALSFVDAVGDTDRVVPGSGHRLVLCTEGEAEVLTDDDRMSLRRGHACYVAADEGTVRVRGAGTVVQAYSPTA
ncbi:mannose-6-phosphate isomerase [Mumia flava]|uniref:mannose-6-phosphate isomerase n=1 Tax=Mumia flava TaxID=1348852 RepID=A0A0B2BU02_9ACTN|nr:mannose-6-phosphate isomerase, class I [Mumia flava]PJJ57133.1 mannose-6-phosphate isomerase [Mumia flava]